MGNLVYILPYLRKGLVSSIKAEGDKDAEDGVKGVKRATVDVGIRFNKKNVGSPDFVTHDVDGQTIELYGPSDVKGISLNSLIRVSPAESGDVRLNSSYKPYMEFYEEDLPWRYTPFAAISKDFFPWMRLIAVKMDEYTISFRNGVKVANITLSEERINEVFLAEDNIEDLKKSAHVQIDVPDDIREGEFTEEYVNSQLDENPDCGIARVVCPSVLEKDTQYAVLLIPTYEQGRLAGLGQNAEAAAMNSLVRPEAGVAIEIPCYYKWKMMTAKEEGTFLALAKRMLPTTDEQYSDMAANLTVDISESGLQTVHFDAEETIDVPAALVMNTDPYCKDPETMPKLREESDEYRAELQRHLALNPVFDENETGEINQDEDPWVVPPVYGARHLMTTRKDFAEGPEGNVVNEVNIKLQNRIPAGMGASVIKKNQETLVNRAWKKVETVNACNQQLREFCQMKTVSECSKRKNIRETFRQQQENDTLRITEKNKGLFCDANYRVLQTSGIYYNNVDLDKAHSVNEILAKAESERDNGTISAGISKDYLTELFSQGEWERIVLEDCRYDALSDSYNAESSWSSVPELAKISFLSKMFMTAKTETKAIFVMKDDDDVLKVNPSSVLNDDHFADKLGLISSKADPFNMTETYKCLHSLSNYSETFSKADQSFGDVLVEGVGLRPLYCYSINAAITSSDYKDSKVFIVDDARYGDIRIGDEALGNKPLAVRYYKDRGEFQKGKKESYMFLVPLSYLKGLRNAKYYTMDGGRKQSLEYVDGKFRIANVAGNNLSLRALEPTATKLYEQLTWNNERFRDYYRLSLYKEGSSKNKKYEHDETGFQLKYDGTEFRTSLAGKKYYWLRWQRCDDNAKTFFSFEEKTRKWEVRLSAYQKLIGEMLGHLENFTSMIAQPTLVEFPLTPNSCVVVDADDFFLKSLERERNNPADAEDFEKNAGQKLIMDTVGSTYNYIVDTLGTVQPVPHDPAEDEGSDFDIGDKEKSLQDLIGELQGKYGVTEDNQIVDRIHDKYPVMVHPDYLEPTYFYLRELSVDYILPAAGSLVNNTISCFYSNSAFEESFLMGMNTEMGRELMWREYPTDQRGSYFRKFWQQTVLPEKGELKTLYYDVNDLDKWKQPLGGNHKDGKDAMLVFAIKGQLMCTFPDTDIYLQERAGDGRLGTEIITPAMTSWLTGDTYLVGFSGLKKSDLGNYYLAFRQKPLSLQFSKEEEKELNAYGVVSPQCFYIKPVC